MQLKIRRINHSNLPPPGQPMDPLRAVDAIILEATLLADDGAVVEPLPAGATFQWFLEDQPIDNRSERPNQCIIDRTDESLGQYCCEVSGI